MATAQEVKNGIIPLNGKNYSTWRLQVKMALMKDGLWAIVQGNEAAPEATAAADVRSKYTARVHRALATIVLAVDTSLLYLVGDSEDPAALWTKLEGQYEKKSWSNKLQLRRRLHTTTLQDGGSVQEHIKNMVEIYEELGRQGDPLKEEDQVIYLLASLPEKFFMLVTALEANSEVPKLELVTEKLIHEESKLSKKIASSSESEALLSSHKNNRNFSNKVVCFSCGEQGHIKRFCNKNSKKPKSKSYVAAGADVDLGSDFSDNGLVAESEVSLTVNNSENWIVDSGATAHMSYYGKEHFSNYVKLEKPINVSVGDGRVLNAIGKGDIHLQFWLPSGELKSSKLNKVLHVPDMSKNLISVSMAALNGKSTIFDDKECKFFNNKKECVAYATKKGNLYYLNCEKEEKSAHSYAASENDDLWHRRLGHVSSYAMNKLADDKLFSKVDLSNECEPCINSKNKRNPFPTRSSIAASRPFEIIHSDVCSVGTQSLSGCQYFLTFIDDFSRHVWIFFLKNKSEVFGHFKNWKNMIEKQFEYKIKVLRSDHGGEYLSNQFCSFLISEGIIHQKSVPKNPEQNGVSERMNRTLVEMLRCMLEESKLPKRFWAEALNTAAYLRNRLPTKSLGGKTPFEVLFKNRPDYGHMKVFGCKSFAHIPKDERSKLDSKSKNCIFLGYSNCVKGYRLFDISKNKIFFSRDVIFCENEKSILTNSSNSGHVPVVELSNNEDESVATPEDCSQGEQVPVRPKRDTRPPDRYGEWATVALADSKTPSSIDEALSGPESELWKNAMDKEINSLKKNDAWHLEPLPQGKKPVGCRFIFKKKIGSDGKVNEFKSRLVAQGFTQKVGIDFEETFSPVIRFETVRTLLAFSVQNDMNLHHMDVCSAFLNGELKEEVYMRQPEGYVEDGNEHLFCRLNKSIYGLRQSPKCWNLSLHNSLVQLGFVQSAGDSCLYSRFENGDPFFIAVYVDDLILSCKNKSSINDVKLKLCQKYELKDLGGLKYFLGVEVDSTNTSLWLGQPIYIDTLLDRFNMKNCKPVTTPFDYNDRKNDQESSKFDVKVYKQAVGSLIYLSVRTRPDISFSVNRAAQNAENPTENDWSRVKRIFRYLKGTKNTGILFTKTDGFQCEGFVDSDWAGDAVSRKSTSGYIFISCGGPISWQSRKQTSVALSSAEAEYVSLASCIQEALWLNSLLVIFSPGHEYMLVNVDNMSAIQMAKNDQFHKRTKHISIKYNFVRDSVGKNLIKLKYCATEHMSADFLTKGLTHNRLEYLKNKVGIISKS